MTRSLGLKASSGSETPTKAVQTDKTASQAAMARSEQSTWREDMAAGLVVFLVAVPLCLGIALASGAPMASGLLTGIIGGLVVSHLSGSQLMVSGPAAGLTAIVLASITQLGSFQAFLVAVILAGVLQIILGLLRAGVIGYFFPSSVIRGMLTGIGLILILKQLPYAVGWHAAPAGQPLLTSAENDGLSYWLPQLIAQLTPMAVCISLVALALLAYWPRLVSPKLRQFLPAPLGVVMWGAVSVWAIATFWPEFSLPIQAMVHLPVAESMSDLMSYLTWPDWSALSQPMVYKVAVTLAIVASLESLLSLEATDRLDPLKRVAPPDREMLAQGAGNILSGLIGGLPMTGVIVRSAANVDAGGKTWRASFVHGVLLVAAIVAIPTWLNLIPLAALAAVLIYTGFKLAHPRQIWDAWHRGPKYAVPFFATVIAILAADLLVGIAIGLAIGIFFLLLDSARNAYSFERRESEDHHEVWLTLAEEVTFLNKAQISTALHALPEGAKVTVDASRSKHLDEDVVELLHEFMDTARSRGIEMILKGVPNSLPKLAH